MHPEVVVSCYKAIPFTTFHNKQAHASGGTSQNKFPIREIVKLLSYIYDHIIFNRQNIQKICLCCCQRLTFSVRFEVAVDGRRCDITETSRPVTQGGAAPLAGGQRSGESWEIKVMWPGAHRNVDILRTVSLGSAERRGARIHGHVVVIGVATIRASQRRFGSLGQHRGQMTVLRLSGFSKTGKLQRSIEVNIVKIHSLSLLPFDFALDSI